MAAKLVVGGRKWVSTELKGTDIGRFREYLRDMRINFETSQIDYSYIHFECLMNVDELRDANKFIDTL